MIEKFYEKYSTEEQDVIVLIQKVLGASPFEDQWDMLATTLGMVFCGDGKVDVKKRQTELACFIRRTQHEKRMEQVQKWTDLSYQSTKIVGYICSKKPHTRRIQ